MKPQQPEAPDEMKSRLEQMAEKGSDWDLSDNDKAAIRWALNAIANLPASRGGEVAEGVREALKAAAHELTTLHGLFATDKPNAFRDGFSEARSEGLDADDAIDAALEDVRESRWEIDTRKTLEKIRKALASSPHAPADDAPKLVAECARLVGLWWRSWVKMQPNPMYYREADRVVDGLPERLMQCFTEAEKAVPAPHAAGSKDQGAPADASVAADLRLTFRNILREYSDHNLDEDEAVSELFGALRDFSKAPRAQAQGVAPAAQALRYLVGATEVMTLEEGSVYHEFYHDPEGSIPGPYNANFYLWCIKKAREAATPGGGVEGGAGRDVRGKSIRFLRLMRDGHIEPAMGWRRKITCGAVSIPVIVHQRARDEAWNISDEGTGCAIYKGAPSPETALQMARDKISMVGIDRFFQGQCKFTEICLGGKRIASFAGNRVEGEKYQEYQAWCDSTREDPKVGGRDET